MTHKIKYCAHCGIRYAFQGSGQGCFHPLNDSNYCPECMAVIRVALDKVPKRVEKRWIPSTVYTKDQILKLMDESDAELDRLHEERSAVTTNRDDLSREA